MKVTMDACLFGALVDVEESQRILDIGTGTGLLSLMAAQRSSAHIDAVELDDDAARQARQNVAQSPWSDRITVTQSAIQQFFGAPDGYDTIICNPPFFENSLKAANDKRTMARHTESLSFSDLVQATSRLLHKNGTAWIILPVKSSLSFIGVVEATNSLNVSSITALRPSPSHPDHRYIITLNKNKSSKNSARVDKRITLYQEGTVFTEQVKALLKRFFLRL